MSLTDLRLRHQSRARGWRAWLVVLCLIVFCGTLWAADNAATPVDWVNTYIGTAGSGSEYGGTMPLVTTPFGMTNWTAQTRQNRISVSSYNYDDRHIQGFIGTHQAAIWMGDYGYVTLIPELDAIKYAPEARALPLRARMKSRRRTTTR